MTTSPGRQPVEHFVVLVAGQAEAHPPAYGVIPFTTNTFSVPPSCANGPLGTRRAFARASVTTSTICRSVEQSDILPTRQSMGGIADQLTGIPLHFPAERRWLIAMLFASALLLLLLVSAIVLFTRGVGIWGINIPVNWAFAIHNYVWWLGIGHAGTLISALLLLTGSEWRNSLNRFAETMTLFAVVCAGIYPLLHLGRPWYVYWMFPYPATMGVWPQFRSPLEWDIWAVMTYLIVSLAFWYTGLIPDLAAARDRTTRRSWQIFFGITALGWRGSAKHWSRWSQTYRLMAGLAVPLVVSVHSEVSLLFAADRSRVGIRRSFRRISFWELRFPDSL